MEAMASLGVSHLLLMEGEDTIAIQKIDCKRGSARQILRSQKERGNAPGVDRDLYDLGRRLCECPSEVEYVCRRGNHVQEYCAALDSDLKSESERAWTRLDECNPHFVRRAAPRIPE
jgi:hypothetical protein